MKNVKFRKTQIEKDIEQRIMTQRTLNPKLSWFEAYFKVIKMYGHIYKHYERKH